MISFHCPSCRRGFTVPDHYANKDARCGCGTNIRVPGRSTATPPPPAGPSLRSRRLAADEKEMRSVFGNGAIRVIQAIGTPPEKYVVEFAVASMVSEDSRSPGGHRAEIELTADYPRVGPRCRMLTPIFHPNIDAASICIGDHWTAGERLSDLVIRIGEMLSYQAYNIRSPLNAEAAMWADLNADRLPIDERDIRSLL